MWMIGSENPDDRTRAAHGLRARSRRACLLAGLVSAVLVGTGSSGCSPRVKIEAPDKPIEINVNIKIEQEIRIKLDKAVENTLQENPELFGTETRP